MRLAAAAAATHLKRPPRRRGSGTSSTARHLPAIPAPWHAATVDAWRNLSAPRTPSFNAHAASHHPTIAALPAIDDDKLHVVDEHMRSRLGTLLSIDDLVAQAGRPTHPSP